MNGRRRDTPTLRVAGWWLGLSGFAVLVTYLSSGGFHALYHPLGVVGVVLSRLALVGPFTTLVAGFSVADQRPVSGRLARVLLPAALVGALCYTLSAFAVPRVDHALEVSLGLDVAARDPFGPHTPIAMVRWRRAVLANPPSEFVIARGQPLRMPPNWLSYLIHFPAAMAGFAVVNGYAGFLIGVRTAGLSPPVRRRRRWAAGLASGTLFLAANVLVSTWVRTESTHPGAIGAWLPTLLWLLATLVCARRWWVARMPSTAAAGGDA